MKHEANIVEKTTVKSASLLDHICHLGLSKHSENYLSNKFGTTSELLWKVRHEAYLREHQPKNAGYLEKPLWDALVAFDRAGYIRHDIKPEDFILNRLRRLAKPEQYQAWNCAADLEDFCEVHPEQGSSDQSDYAYGNQRYENFTPLTEKKPRPYHCLRNRNINTIQDVLALDSIDWGRIRNLGKVSIQEIIQAMHDLGYADFYIPH